MIRYVRYVAAKVFPRHQNNSAWVVLLPMAMLLGQVGLYVWMAPRGFEFTDESYYVLSYLAWRSSVATASFFGALLEGPFLLFGQSVPAMRLLSLGLLLMSGAFAMRAALRFEWGFRSAPDLERACLVLGASASLYYFEHFSTLRAPSYNLLALCAMLVATGLLTRFAEHRPTSNADRVSMLLYGVVLAVCILSKVSSGGLLLSAHAIFVASVNRDWSLRRLLEMLGLVGAGFVTVLAVLHAVLPQWLSVFQEGLLWARTTDPSYGLSSLFNDLRWDVQRQVKTTIPWLFGLVAGTWLVVRLKPAYRRFAVSLWVMILASACSLGLAVDGMAHLWLPLTAGFALAIGWVQWHCRPEGTQTRNGFRSLVLTLLLFSLPLLFSFGTNGRVLAHSVAAASFAIIAIGIGLLRLCQFGLITKLTLTLCVSALCAPPLVGQVRIALEAESTYRGFSSLSQQSVPVSLGPEGKSLLVDAETQHSLATLLSAARSVGLSPNQVIQDFTGDGSGLVYALGGNPLAVAWMGGGYPGSRQAAERLLSLVPPASLQNAWLLTSSSNPRAIPGWQDMVAARAGVGSHVQVASVRIRMPYRWLPDAPELVDVEIWKPRSHLTPAR